MPESSRIVIINVDFKFSIKKLNLMAFFACSFIAQQREYKTQKSKRYNFNNFIKH